MHTRCQKKRVKRKKEAGKAGIKKSKVPPPIQLHLPIARPRRKILLILILKPVLLLLLLPLIIIIIMIIINYTSNIIFVEHSYSLSRRRHDARRDGAGCRSRVKRLEPLS